jgi:hypothetical protein
MSGWASDELDRTICRGRELVPFTVNLLDADTAPCRRLPA